MTVYLLHCRS